VHQFRCYRNGVWENCGINPIDRGFQFEDEFVSGLLTTGAIGSLGWNLSSGGTSTLTYNTTLTPTADRPGVFGIQTGASSGDGSTIWLGGNSTTGTMLINNTNVMKSGVAMGATATNAILRVGMFIETTASTRSNSGVWLEADSSTNGGNWAYCYGNGTTPTCAQATTGNGFSSNHPVNTSTWVRTEIRVTATGTNSSTIVFCLDGDCKTLSGVTVDTTNRVNPSIACFNSTTAARNCYVDYYQLRGVSSAAR
jgi:hypothetical protein